MASSSSQAQAGLSGTDIPTEWPDRHIHDDEWWGKSHSAPEAGHPDRLFMFCQPTEMTRYEENTILQDWNAAVAQSHEETKGLSHHLRPATPSHEKAEKKIRQLEQMGEEVTPEGKEIIRDHFRCNYGLLASLPHWAEGEKFIPIEHANELVQMINRLMLENATQMNVAMQRQRAWGEVLGSLEADSGEHSETGPQAQRMEGPEKQPAKPPQALAETTSHPTAEVLRIQDQNDKIEILKRHLGLLQMELEKATAKWKAEKAARLSSTFGGTICTALKSVVCIFTSPRMGRQRAKPTDEETGRQEVQPSAQAPMASTTQTAAAKGEQASKKNMRPDDEVDVTDAGRLGRLLSP